MISELAHLPHGNLATIPTASPAIQERAVAVRRELPSFDVPPLTDLAEWRAWPLEERARVKELMVAFGEIAARPTIGQGVAAASAARRHMGRGWDARTLGNLFRLYAKGGYKPGDWQKHGPRYAPGDWRCLMRAYKPRESALPAEFLSFWGSVWTEFQGRDDCRRAAWEHLIRNVWLVGKPVPGYGTVDDWCREQDRPHPHPVLIRQDDLPDGWSYDNLIRHLPKRKSSRKQLTQGFFAAHTYQPDMVLGDRSQLLPFEHVMFDDVRIDKRSRFLGQIVYPLMIVGLDAATGVDLAHSCKGRLERDDGTKHGISRDCTRLALCDLLRRWGLPPWKMHIVMENAAATLSPDERRRFKDALGDRIEFETTSIFRERMTAHGFVEKGGTPWNKAPIESYFHVMQLRVAHGEGSTGPRYDLTPGELAELEAYEKKLMDAAGGREDVMGALRWTLPALEEVYSAVQRAMMHLRFRTKHRMQGFEWLEEGRMPDGRWLSLPELQALPEEAVEGVELTRRKEAPAERFCRLLDGVKFDPVPEELLLWLSGEHRPVRVRAGKFTLDHKEERDPLVFREPGHPLLEDVREGAAFTGVLSLNRERLHVYSENGAYQGDVMRQDRIDCRNREALRREAGRVRAARVADRELLRGYLTERDEARLEVQRHNAAVIASAGPALPASASPSALPAPAPESRQTAATRRKNTDRMAQMAASAEAQLKAGNGP